MALQITSLNSGSNGNCYYIGNDQEAILVDAGLSCRETEKRLKRLGLSIRKIKAIFVSHEHSDHIRGIPVITEKHRLPVYITDNTLRGCGFTLPSDIQRTFTAYEPVMIGALAVTAFPKFHDAADPHSFTISSEGLHVGVFTDIGAPCEHLIHHFSQCHAVFLESNYDEEMLNNGSYPVFLKNRIRDGHGHLSNRQALDLFNTHRSAALSHLLLAHLSHNNNDPDLVRTIFTPHAGQTKVIVASRYEETPVYTLEGTHSTTAAIGAPVIPAKTAAGTESIIRTKAKPASTQKTPPPSIQYSLF